MAMKRYIFWGMLLVSALVSSCSNSTSPGDSPSSFDNTNNVPNPPFNNFEPPKSNVPKAAIIGAATGATVGAIVSPGGAAVGAVTGGLVGGIGKAIYASSKETPQELIKQLPKQHIQVVQDGNTITLLVPTDIYYLPDSYEFDDVWYRGLDDIVQLVLKTKTNQMVFVAGFSDDGVGSDIDAQKLSQDRAQQMADFLWANCVPLSQLKVQ